MQKRQPPTQEPRGFAGRKRRPLVRRQTGDIIQKGCHGVGQLKAYLLQVLALHGDVVVNAEGFPGAGLAPGVAGCLTHHNCSFL